METNVPGLYVAGGLVVALDGATGKVKWVFRTVPQGPGDDGWEIVKDTWSGPLRQGGGVWSVPAVDPALGMVYVNVGNPTTNYDGSQRKGSNLFTNAIVALDMNTGKLKWHFQFTPNDPYDYDSTQVPVLVDRTSLPARWQLRRLQPRPPQKAILPRRRQSSIRFARPVMAPTATARCPRIQVSLVSIPSICSSN